MAVIRRNILDNPIVRDQYVRGVKLLKAEDSGASTSTFGVSGADQPVSTYDLFVIWHHRAMMTMTPSGNTSGRNAAHRGPVFCPWHRVMLMVLEKNLQRVLADAGFGIPYWDWGADGDLPQINQVASPLWAAECLGGSGSPVSTGPFAFDAADPNSWRVKVEGTMTLAIVAANRGLVRSLAGDAPLLPSSDQVTNALGLSPYDESTWIADSPGFRSHLEGWVADSGATPPWLHNLVHVWVGGDMSPSTSPNDPVFFLNHCNVDRIWEKWLRTHGRAYLPDMSAPLDLRGHRIDDPMIAPVGGGTTTPRQVLDVSGIYTYDVLP